jgi:uncharacterized membrane protein
LGVGRGVDGATGGRQTASRAGDEVVRLARDLVIEPEAVAVISRDREGKYHVTTTHHPVAEGATWGMLWALSSASCVVRAGMGDTGLEGAKIGSPERIPG